MGRSAIKGKRKARGPCAEAKSQHIFLAALFLPLCLLLLYIRVELLDIWLAEPINSYSWGRRQANTDFLPRSSSSFSDTRAGFSLPFPVFRANLFKNIVCILH